MIKKIYISDLKWDQITLMVIFAILIFGEIAYKIGRMISIC